MADFTWDDGPRAECVARMRRLADIDAAFPFMAGYGRGISDGLARELGVVVSCVRLGTVRTPADLFDRLARIEPATRGDAEVLSFIIPSRNES